MDRSARADILRTVWAKVAATYYDPSMQGLPWKSLGEGLIERLPERQDSESFYGYVNSGLAVLHDAHTRVFSPAEVRRRRQERIVSTGLEIDMNGLVIEIAAGSEAEREGLRPAMRVASIDGEPVMDRSARLRGELGLDDPAFRLTPAQRRFFERRVAVRMLAGAPGSAVTLRLDDADAPAIVLHRRDTALSPASTVRMITPRVAYIELGEFSSKSVAVLAAALKQLDGATGLVIDLRRNGGGDARDALRAAGMFFAAPVPFGSLVTRDGRPPSLFGGLYKLPMQAETRPDPAHYVDLPVMLLVGTRTASAAEGFVAALRDNGRATVVGGLTCGCTNIVLRTIRLRDGGELKVSNLGSRSPRGTIIEGAGIPPDVEVAPDFRGSGRDEGLAAAVRLLEAAEPAVPEAASRPAGLSCLHKPSSGNLARTSRDKFNSSR